jgi:hypothetical protein
LRCLTWRLMVELPWFCAPENDVWPRLIIQ